MPFSPCLRDISARPVTQLRDINDHNFGYKGVINTFDTSKQR